MIRIMEHNDLAQCGRIYAPAAKFYEKNGFKFSNGTIFIVSN